jgi:hypothetical protein
MPAVLPNWQCIQVHAHVLNQHLAGHEFHRRNAMHKVNVSDMVSGKLAPLRVQLRFDLECGGRVWVL